MSDAQLFVVIASAVATVTTGAMIAVIRLFLRAMRDERDSFEMFLSNHMSANTSAMERLTYTVQALSREVHAQALDRRKERGDG